MMPLGGCPIPPAEKIVTAYSTNPRLRARQPRAQELLVEEMTGEQISMRMLSRDSGPVAFVVPDGCNAVDFMLGPIEINPGVGHEGDLDAVVSIGPLSIDGVGSKLLNAGDQISVVVPWRYGSWIELAADHLRLPIFARFYLIETY